MRKIPATVALPGSGPLQSKLTERDRELASAINRVGDVFDFGSYNYPQFQQIGWRDLIGEIDTRGLAGAAVPVFSAITGLGGLYAHVFSATVLQECFVTYHLDHDIYTGSDSKIYLHTHWINAAATPNTGTVRWGFEYTLAKGHQQEAFPAPQTVYVTQTCSATRYMHHIAEISVTDAISGSSIEPDALLMVRIFRDATNDTCTDAVYLLLADCHYMADRFSTMNKSPNFNLPRVDQAGTPQAGSLVLTGNVPGVKRDWTVSPSVGALSITGQVPTVT